MSMVLSSSDSRGPGASWWDMILGDDAGNADAIDISKMQQLLLSAVAFLTYGVALGRILFAAGTNTVSSFPDMPESFLALIGASHATYLTYKATSHDN